jgi:4-amino-4-deoxy-L-arabinose transferase-like glycosyltransferase
VSTTSAEPRWPRPAIGALRGALAIDWLRDSAPLAGLLALTAALYLWALSRNGYANEYYAAAVQAGTHSWKAFLFGSFDAANYITVDKPPASLWLMELSSRLFGFSSFSMLLPQALEGVGAVALLYATVRRWFGRSAGLLCGLLLALTPVAALMFRFNNPDALLVLLFVASAYAVTRALESGATRWVVLAGAVVGLAFLTKELQALLVVPVLALTYLVAAPVSFRRRAWQLLAGGAAIVASAGWWVALVELWPASSRPYFGDSTTNSILQVIFGSNGLDRISSGGLGGGPGGGFSGSAGILRLFNAEMGGQIAWLLPGAAMLLVAGLVWTARRPRTDRTRAGLLLWGGWLVVMAAVFSLMTGIIHPYYTSSLAPAVAAIVGVGVTILWRRRDQGTARLLLSSVLAVSAVLSYVLLGRSPTWHPWLRFVVLAGGLGAAAGLAAAPRLSGRARRAAATVGILTTLAGPTAYTLSAVASTQAGGNPTAGPSLASSGYGGDGFPGQGRGLARSPAGGAPGAGEGPSVTRSLAALLEADASRYTWVAATTSTQTGASLELATGRSVMAIGGFQGSDPAITLVRFKQLVAGGRIHYFVAGGGPGIAPGGPVGPGIGPGGPVAPAGPTGALGGGGPVPSPGFAGRRARGLGALRATSGGGPVQRNDTVARRIQSWVSSHFSSTTVGDTKVYDLTRPILR